ncbi:MAG: nickel-type superoxide dismutase maturation protease [Chloroflexi bacterium]|nr:nickel-type superoxide dismutase maturation protease [Chloroflexota bacterium]
MSGLPRGACPGSPNPDDLNRARFRAGIRFGIGVAAVVVALAPPVARILASWRLRSAVEGMSMRPTLEPGDWLLVDPGAYASRPPRVADLVAVPDPGEPSRWLVKRVVDVDADGRLELRGDNPAESTDSRTFGTVDAATVIGRPWARYWPVRRVGRVR